MAKMKLMKYPEDVYFKKTVNYELEVGGRPITVCIEEDTHGGDVHYLHEDGNWSVSQPDWIRELGENEWGESIFESVVFENLHCMAVDEEIYTHEDDEL